MLLTFDWSIKSDVEGNLSIHWNRDTSPSTTPLISSCESCGYGENLNFTISKHFVATMNPYTDGSSVIIWYDRRDLTRIAGKLSSSMIRPEYGMEIIEH